MAETNSDIKIGSDWVSINTLTGISIGEAVVIQNTGSPGDIISLWIGSEPLTDEVGIALDQIKAFLEVPANNSEIWARYYRVDNKNVGAKLVTANVQLLDGAIIPGSPSGMAIRKYLTLSQPRILTTGLTQAEIATIEGDRFSYVTRISNVDIATPVYILIENPADSGVNVGFQERIFNTIVGGATFQVLWDYDVSTATKTPVDTFNQNNLFRGFKNGLLEISVLNGVTESQGNYTVTGPATIISEGVQREISQVPTTGQGTNTKGDISPALGFRVYGQGTGALIKITSAVNDNIVINGYDWIEAPTTL